jgi:hypothetical protein
MIVSASSRKEFQMHPEGAFAAICVDVIDLGMQESNFDGKTKMQHKVRIAFLTSEKQENGEPSYISQRFTASLDDRATLRSFLESWRGRKFTAEEALGFDMETLVGVGAMLEIIHEAGRKDPSKVYDNIFRIGRLPKVDAFTGEPIIPVAIPSNFVRAQDKAKTGAPE